MLLKKFTKKFNSDFRVPKQSVSAIISNTFLCSNIISILNVSGRVSFRVSPQPRNNSQVNRNCINRIFHHYEKMNEEIFPLL